MPRPLRRHPSQEDLSGAINSRRRDVPSSSTSAQQHRGHPAHLQTPPSRHTPSNPTHRYQPSSDAHQITPDTLPMAMPATHHHPAARANPFTVFGPAGLEAQQAAVMDDDDEFDDDYEPHAHSHTHNHAHGPGPTGDGDEEFGVDEQVEGGEDSDELEGEEEEVDEMVDEQLEGEEVDIDADEEMRDREKFSSPLPPNLREISSLASWTVSTSKPGCGVAALRHPSPTQYWQSDGPQPHTLTLHFFKLVAVVRIRVYLDFELDESYTPTKMVFLAGMGGNDLVEFATWEGDGPCGWVDVSLDGVGGRNGGWVSGIHQDGIVRSLRRGSRGGRGVKNGMMMGSSSSQGRKHVRAEHGGGYEDDAENEEVWETAQEAEVDDNHAEDDNVDDGDDDYDTTAADPDDPYSGNVLKAMVIQMRVMENHQNGKDTHVRGFQVFACDDSRRRLVSTPSACADGRHRRQSVRHSLRAGAVHDPLGGHARLGSEDIDAARLASTSGLNEPDWMGEPVIR